MDIKRFEGSVEKSAVSGARSVSGKGPSKQDEKLRRACADFEGILMQLMFESMKKTVGKGGVFGNSFQQNIYESLFVQKISETLAREKSLGLGDALYRQLKNEVKDEAKEAGRISRYR